jgi:G3E family GTPase
MSKTLVACVGGFLGAGKTTALQKAAEELSRRGMKAAVVVNDQGDSLVDTHSLRSSGAITEEITGGCFCCKFDDLVKTLIAIREREQPDVILAEAVGSCTDLAATVYRPLRRYYGRRFALAPLTVLTEPGRIRAMSDESASAFPESVRYLFQKQIAEADLVVLNKCDTVSAEERSRLIGLIRAEGQTAPVHCMSAFGGTGIVEWVDLLLGGGEAADREVDVDYETYTEAEATLAWLNATVDVDGAREFSPREFAERFIRGVQDGAGSMKIAIAHVKALVDASAKSDRIALVDNTTDPQWSGIAQFDESSKVSLIINARVGSTPQQLSTLITGSLQESARALGVETMVRHIECFSPQKPTPRYRFTHASQATGRTPAP